MKIIEVDIGLLKPYEDNAKLHDDVQVSNVAESIRQFGWQQPIVVDKDYVVIIGHCRLEAAQKLGLEKVPVTVADNLDEEQVKKLRLLDNKLNESDWDLEKLAKEVLGDEDNLPLDFDGFDIDWAIKQIEPEAKVEDDEFDLDSAITENPASQLGDIYVLGRHRLMCGDSTKVEDVTKLADKRKVTCVFTDPPWNVDYGGSSHPSWRKRSILNDKMSPQDFNIFLTEAFVAVKNIMKQGCMFYCVMSPQEWGNIMDVMSAQDYHWSSTIIWAKDSLVLSRKDYHTQYEPIWYGWWQGKDNAPRLHPLEDRKQSDLWEIERPKVSELHPTTKPVPLVARALMNSSNKGDDVCDLFGGSGTTLIAAEQTERSCLMMELDPKYVDVIVKRYISLIGGTKNCYLIRNGERMPLPDEFLA